MIYFTLIKQLRKFEIIFALYPERLKSNLVVTKIWTRSLLVVHRFLREWWPVDWISITIWWQISSTIVQQRLSSISKIDWMNTFVILGFIPFILICPVVLSSFSESSRLIILRGSKVSSLLKSRTFMTLTTYKYSKDKNLVPHQYTLFDTSRFSHSDCRSSTVKTYGI